MHANGAFGKTPKQPDKPTSYGGAEMFVFTGGEPMRVLRPEDAALKMATAGFSEAMAANPGSTDVPLDGTLISGAAIAQRSISHPAVCVAPGGSFLFHLYGTSMAAATTCEVEVGHVER